MEASALHTRWSRAVEGRGGPCNGLRMWAHRSDLPVLEILALLLPKPSFRGGRRRRVRIRFPYTELSGAKGV